MRPVTILSVESSVTTFSVSVATFYYIGNLLQTLRRMPSSTHFQSVDYTITLGTAEAGDVSEVLTGTVTFQPGELSQTITLATIEDLIDETDETVTVTLSNPQGEDPDATPPVLGNATATGTIRDDDASEISISVSGATVDEGGNLVFTVSRTLASEQIQTVDYTITRATGKAGDVGAPLTGTVTFAPGELSQTITLATIEDLIDETDETVTVTLSNPQGEDPDATPPVLGNATATGTIRDDDASGISISVSGATVDEGGNLVFTVSRTLASEQIQTVDYTITLG